MYEIACISQKWTAVLMIINGRQGAGGEVGAGA